VSNAQCIEFGVHALPVTSDEAVLVAIMILFFSLTIEAKASAHEVAASVHDDATPPLVEPLARQGDGNVRLVLVIADSTSTSKSAPRTPAPPAWCRSRWSAVDVGDTDPTVVHDADSDHRLRLRPGQSDWRYGRRRGSTRGTVRRWIIMRPVSPMVLRHHRRNGGLARA